MSSKEAISLVCQQIGAAASLQELLKILKTYLSSYSIESYALSYYGKHPKTGSTLVYDYVSPPLKIWHQHYLEESYAEVDLTLASSYFANLPVFWDVCEQQLNAKCSRELRMRNDSIEFGIDKGLSLPIHGPNSEFMTLALHQRKGEDCLKDYEERQYDWLLFALTYFARLKTLLPLVSSSAASTLLTVREEQCINLTELGYSVTQIADELKITERTVNFHLQNSNKKLGTNSKYLSIDALRKIKDASISITNKDARIIATK